MAKIKIRNLIFLSSVIILTACSSNKKDKEIPEVMRRNHSYRQAYIQNAKALPSLVEECLEFKNKVLKKAVGLKGQFLRDESDAIVKMDQFDYGKLSAAKENELSALVLFYDPSPQTAYYFANFMKNQKSCKSGFSELKFMKGLVYGLNQYEWSRDAVLKGKTLLKRYLRYKLNYPMSLVEIGIVSSLIDEMFDKNLIQRFNRNKFKAFTQKLSYLLKKHQTASAEYKNRPDIEKLSYFKWEFQNAYQMRMELSQIYREMSI